MIPKHAHRFRLHVGIKVFGGTAWAWVEWDPRYLDGRVEMWRCIDCGEQGYEIAA